MPSTYIVRAFSSTLSPDILSTRSVQFAKDTMAGRTVSGSFGSASDGINVWQTPNLNTGAIVGVSSNEANVYYDNLGAGAATYATNIGLGAVRDVNLSLRFSFLTAFTGTTSLGLVARYRDANNWYRATFVGSHLFFVKKVAGTTTTIQVASFTATASVYYNLRFQLTAGSLAITIWQDGTSEPAPQWTGADTSLKLPGSYGMVTVSTGTSAGAGVSFDSFLARSVATQLVDIYVNAITGSDNNPGTQASPVATMQQGLNLSAPGSIVHMASTVSTQNIIMYASGTGGNPIELSYPQSASPDTRIVIQSNVQSGATIRAPGAAFLVDVKGSYIDILGFEIGGDNLANMGIHFNGPGCSAQRCYVHDIQSPNATYPSGGGGVVAQGQATTNTLVNACLITNTGTLADLGANIVQPIYLQSTASAATNNIICGSYSSGITAIHWSNSITITNNIIANTYLGLQIGGTDIGITCDNSVVANNVFDWYGSLYQNGTASVYSTYIVAREQGACGSNNVYKNNLVWGPTVGPTGSGPTWQYQLQNGLVDTGTINTNPVFVNFQGDGSGDYHVFSQSPCIDAGTATGAPSMDFAGSKRSQGAAYDIGAYEGGITPPSKNYTYGSAILHDSATFYLQEKPFSIVPLVQTLQKGGRQDGMWFSGQSTNARTITVKIKVVGQSRADLENLLSTLHQGLALRQQPLTIYALDNRYYTADAVVTDENLVGGQPNSVLVQVTFVCQQPYAYAPTNTRFDTGTVLLTGSGTTWNFPVQTIASDGNVFSRPTIRIYQRVTSLAWTGLTLTQQPDGNTMTLTTGLPTIAGDYIDIFCDPVLTAQGSGYTVQKNSNGVPLTFTGQFPLMEPGSTSWTITITAPSAPQAQAIWTWAPRWLP